MANSPKRFAGAVAFLMLLGTLIAAVPASASPNPVPVLTIRLDTSEQLAKVSESAQGSVTFTGTIVIDKLPIERCVVSLVTSVDTGWASSISPSSLVFQNTNPQGFTVAVVVPQATPATQIGTLKIDGKAVAGGLVAPGTTQAIIRVAPYFRLMLESDMPYKEITPGSQAFYSFKLWNVGNAIDSFDMEIPNLKDLVGKKWTVTLSTTTVSKVNPNEYKTVRITAQSPRDWTVYKSEPTMITLKATSQNAKEVDQTVVTQNFPLYAYEKGFYIPGFEPLFLLAALALGIVVIKRKRK